MRHCEKLAVTVNCTNRCNLRCEYCMASSPAEQAHPRSISWDFARKGIHDAVHGHPTGIKAEILRFFSPGEPTQEMGLIRSCVSYARQLNPRIRTELQTNGLFPSDEETLWIAKNIDVVWFSLDGPPEVNDVHRPDDHNRGRTADIERNLVTIAKTARVGVRSTIVEETIDHQDDLVEYYHRLGLRDLAFNPIIRPICRNDSGTVPVTRDNNVMRFARGFVRAHARAQQLGVRLLSSLTFNFDEPTAVACRSCLPMPQLNPDGSVSSCDMALYSDTKQELRCFIYGVWDPAANEIHYDMEKVAHLQQRTVHNLPKCVKCPVRDYCAGGCAGRIAFQTGSIYDVIPEYCRATIYLARNIPVGQRLIRLSHP